VMDYYYTLNELRLHLLKTFPEMLQVYTTEDLKGFSAVRSMDHLVMNGMNPSRTGDLVFELRSNFITGNHEVGTTHGSSFDYDTHVPLLFFGNGVPKKKSVEEVYIMDIAPTISNILGMMEPDGCIGRPLF
jgi:bisphosphoglycerate-independent phosphoglycerate mutase (AlkP superfamily)